MKRILIPLLILGLALPASAEEEIPPREDIKGLVFIQVIKPPKIRGAKRAKKYKIYHYKTIEGKTFSTKEKIAGVPDLTRFDEIHPKWARFRDWLGVGNTVTTAGALAGGMLIAD